MTHRENLFRALRRQQPHHVPFFFTLCDDQIKTCREKTGTEDFFEAFDLPIRYVSIGPSRHIPDYSPYYPGLPQGAYLDEWGVGYAPGRFHHFTRMLHPMQDFTSPAQVESFPLPDLLADYRWEGVTERIQEIQQAGYMAVYFALQIFEPAWYLRGMDQFLIDMLEDEDMTQAMLERITHIQCGFARRLAQCGIDMIVYGDDVGSQRGMMMSPRQWRHWLKPTMQRAIAAAKKVKPDMLAFYHSDGDIRDIIPELIEIGVDVLNPVQPECMDPREMKARYGDRLSFWGTIGTQTTLPFGTPGQVRQAVREMIDTVGVGGGLVLAPTHLVEPEVPWENLLAFVDEARHYGIYR